MKQTTNACLCVLCFDTFSLINFLFSVYLLNSDVFTITACLFLPFTSCIFCLDGCFRAVFAVEVTCSCCVYDNIILVLGSELYVELHELF